MSKLAKPPKKHKDSCDSSSDSEDRPCPPPCPPCLECKRFVVIDKQAGTYIITGAGNGTTYCLKNNIVHDLTLGPAIRIVGATGITLKLGGNSISGLNAGPFVPVAGVASPGNGPALIQIENSSEVTVTGDNVNSALIGILVQNSVKVTLDNVRATRNVHGIVLRDSRNVTLVDSETDGVRASLWLINSDLRATNNKFSPVPAAPNRKYIVGGIVIQNPPPPGPPDVDLKLGSDTKLSKQTNPIRKAPKIATPPPRIPFGAGRHKPQRGQPKDPCGTPWPQFKSAPPALPTSGTKAKISLPEVANKFPQVLTGQDSTLWGGALVEFDGNFFANNNILVAQANSFTFTNNQSLQEADLAFSGSQLQLGQDPDVVIDPTLPPEQQETYPAGSAQGVRLAYNYFGAINNGTDVRNIVVNQASGVDIIENELQNNSPGSDIGTSSSIFIGTEQPDGLAHVDGVSIERNTISEVVGGPIPVFGILIFSEELVSCANSNIRNITIRGNQISARATGINVSRVNAVIVVENDLGGITSDGIRVIFSSGIIRDNNLIGTLGNTGITASGFDDCVRVLSAGNQVTGFALPYQTALGAVPDVAAFSDAPYFNIPF